MTTVLEEVTSDELSREHIERRVEDWAQRIDDLYRAIASWLPGEWRGERDRNVRMDAPLMRKFGVPSRELPILTLMHEGRPAGYVEPRGLWIIGLNGRLDLHYGAAQYIVFDEAENFAPPDWRITLLQNRTNRDRFDRDKLLSILEHAPTAGN